MEPHEQSKCWGIYYIRQNIKSRYIWKELEAYSIKVRINDYKENC
jgi:hypothetical protein